MSRRTIGEQLARETHRFSFFQAIRMLEIFSAGRSTLGRDGPPRRETVRFRVEQSLSFPASELLELVEGADEAPPEVTVRFFGLTGPQGVLPRHYSEFVIARVRRKDRTLAEFLDLFSHRAISFFYRAWEKYRAHLRHDPGLVGEYATWVFSLFGFGTPGLRGRTTIPDRVLPFYSGLLAQRPHSQAALEGILEDFFGGIRARVVPFIGQWLALDAGSLTRVGRLGANSRLGVDTVLGSRVWNTQSRFRVRLGPMSWDRFREFLPCGPSSESLLEMTRLVVGQEYDFEFQLVLQAQDVPSIRLGATGADAPRLGWSTWVGVERRSSDAEESVLDGELLRRHHEKRRKGEP